MAGTARHQRTDEIAAFTHERDAAPVAHGLAMNGKAVRANRLRFGHEKLPSFP